MPKSTNINIIKKQLLVALQKSLGIVTTACQKVNIDRTTFYNYYNNDENFRNAVDDIENTTIDFVESKLYKQIAEGNVTAIIFYLKTKGRKRGYNENMELDIKANVTYQVYKLSDGTEIKF